MKFYSIMISFLVFFLTMSVVTASVFGFFGNFFGSDYDCDKSGYPMGNEGERICVDNKVWECTKYTKDYAWNKTEDCGTEKKCTETGVSPNRDAYCLPDCTCENPYGKVNDRICGKSNEIRECQMNNVNTKCYWYEIDDCTNYDKICSNAECVKTGGENCVEYGRKCSSSNYCCKNLECCDDNICRYSCENIGYCEDDCTYTIDNICHKECKGREGCSNYFKDEFDGFSTKTVYKYSEIYGKGKYDECMIGKWMDYDGDNVFDLSGDLNVWIKIKSDCTELQYPNLKYHYYTDDCPYECTRQGFCGELPPETTSPPPTSPPPTSPPPTSPPPTSPPASEPCFDFGGSDDLWGAVCDDGTHWNTKRYIAPSSSFPEEQCKAECLNEVGYCSFSSFIGIEFEEYYECFIKEGIEKCFNWNFIDEKTKSICGGTETDVDIYKSVKTYASEDKQSICMKECKNKAKDYYCQFKIVDVSSGSRVSRQQYQCIVKHGYNSINSLYSSIVQPPGQNNVEITGEFGDCLIIITNSEGKPLTLPVAQECDTSVSFYTESEGVVLIRVIIFEPSLQIIKKYIAISGDSG